jgi:AraC-like DNA-binding protein
VALRRCLRAAQPAAHLQDLLALLDEMLGISQVHAAAAASLPAKRPATRRMLLIRLQRAKEMIEDQTGRVPELDALARECGLSRFHLLRLFKAAFGVAPMRYAEQCRIERAKELLRRTRLPVAVVAERVGYESPAAFTRAFRRRIGIAPTAFRGA